jgi:hypothetical protein
MVKAIETSYAGCRFRSRLEARWAVVLDHLQVPWEFEPQGYDLPSGRYLPDFRIPGPDGQPFYLEIKGPMPDTHEFEVASEINLYVAPLIIFQGDVPRRSGEGTAWIFIPAEDGDGGDWIMSDPEQALIFGGSHELPPNGGLDGWNAAVTAGRSARFEHGENG